MKNLIKIPILMGILMFSIMARGQENVPLINQNSEWFYDVHPFIGCFPCLLQFQQIKVVGDTIIQSKNCFILEKTSPGTLCDDMGTSREFIYQEGQEIYWYNKHIDVFTVLYDFAAEKGDTWELKVSTCSFIVRVDSISSININGIHRKVIHVSDEKNYFNGSIIEQIGHTTSMFPKEIYYECDEIACDSDFVNGLRCYLDNGEIKYKKGEIDCDSVYQLDVSVDELDTSTISIFPNPVDTKFSLIRNNCYTDNLDNENFIISNCSGQILRTGLYAKEKYFDVSDLKAGVYFFILINNSNETIYRNKFIKL
jgi:hypothetical protein